MTPKTAAALLCLLSLPGHASLRNVLHFHKLGYFEHPGGIAACSTALEQLSAEYFFRVKHSKDPADLLHLNVYDLVIYDNTTDAGGVTNTITAPQTALVEYMNSGGRLLGIHGAADHRSLWSWYDTVLFSGTKVTHWSDGSHVIYKNGLPDSDSGRALARMWRYAADSLGIPSDSIPLNGEMLHWNRDVAGRPGIVVLQELRGYAAQNGVSESHAWVNFLPGGGRMLFTAMGHEANEWTANNAEEGHLRLHALPGRGFRYGPRCAGAPHPYPRFEPGGSAGSRR